MEKSVFEISQMDCPSEESLIRMKLDEIKAIEKLDFDIPNRKLVVFHNGEANEIERSILNLNLGGKKLSCEKVFNVDFTEDQNQRKLLWTVLWINFGFFILEMITGLISKSMGLVADSLDMLADAFVYGISLWAVGKSIYRKKQIAQITGYFQIILAIVGFIEVLRRFLSPNVMPDFSIMIIVSVFALSANVLSLYLLQKSKSKNEVHIKASTICTSNDVIINFGVIVAGGLVYWLSSNKPDLIIGSVVFVLVIRGAIRILKISK